MNLLDISQREVIRKYQSGEAQQPVEEHFPYTNGDVVERHQYRLREVLQADYRNYMQQQKRHQKVKAKTSLDQYTQVLSERRYQPQTVDSLGCYVKPELNPRVLQDAQRISSYREAAERHALTVRKEQEEEKRKLRD